jgi:UDP-glucose 4-epimerase
MRIVVTGSSGHLGEGLARTLRARGDDVVGVDIRDGEFTTLLGSVSDEKIVREALEGAESVFHTATLHKPHIATHSRGDFVDTNIVGTLRLLEESVRVEVSSFLFTSTTSAFGRALIPEKGAPAAWITEDVVPKPKNIYGATKVAAEDLCELVHRDNSLPCIILRTSRFFPDEDDRAEIREKFVDENVKVNEFLYRRVDLGDAVEAHLAALERASDLGFGRYIISATTPFGPENLLALRGRAPEVVAQLFPEFAEVYERKGWKMFDRIERVYVNEKARRELGWQPAFDFASILSRLARNEHSQSALAREVGSKGYHDQSFSEGPYPILD